MAKLLILSPLFVPLLIARYAATVRNPRRGARITAGLALAFGAFFVFVTYFLYFKLL